MAFPHVRQALFFRSIHQPSGSHIHITSSATMLCTTANSKIDRPFLRGVIFDMDGTLTIPNLDFAEMYDRCGVDRSGDILKSIATMEPDAAEKANAIVEEMEEEGRRTLKLMPGTVGLLQWLAFHRIATALVTRNTYASTLRLVELLQQADPTIPAFSPIIPRDFQRAMLPKPHTDALNYISTEWKMDLTNELLMVGDSPANDIVFGKNAGIATALLWEAGECSDTAGADIVVSQLTELPRYLHERWRISLPEHFKKESSPTPAPKPVSTAAKAAYNGDVDAIRRLPKGELIAKDEGGNTPLIWASEAGHTRVVEFILEQTQEEPAHHQHINEKGFRGSTAISRAARHGHVSIVKLLTKQSALNANLPNSKLQYPLHVAAFRQHSTIVQYLLRAGADPHVVDRKGKTPLADTKCSKTQELLRSAMVLTT